MDFKKKNNILIFTPTYNEAENIEKLLSMLIGLNINADFLVIDDGSPDGTAMLIKQFSSNNPHQLIHLIERKEKKGIGSAHLMAIDFANHNKYLTLITMDADFSHQPADIPRFIEAIPNGDVILGSRFNHPESLAEWGLLRKTITHTGHFLTKILLGMPFDASGGLRLYQLNQISPSIFNSLSSKDYEFFFESLLILHMSGYKICEIPVVLPARIYGSSKMEFGHMIRGVYRLFLLSLRLHVMRLKFSKFKA